MMEDNIYKLVPYLREEMNRDELAEVKQHVHTKRQTGTDRPVRDREPRPGPECQQDLAALRVPQHRRAEGARRPNGACRGSRFP